MVLTSKVIGGQFFIQTKKLKKLNKKEFIYHVNCKTCNPEKCVQIKILKLSKLSFKCKIVPQELAMTFWVCYTCYKVWCSLRNKLKTFTTDFWGEFQLYKSIDKVSGTLKTVHPNELFLSCMVFLLTGNNSTIQSWNIDLATQKFQPSWVMHCNCQLRLTSQWGGCTGCLHWMLQEPN